jgi:hypothetical protein
VEVARIMTGFRGFVSILPCILLASLPVWAQDSAAGTIAFIYKDEHGLHAVQPGTDTLFSDEDFRIVLTSARHTYMSLVHKSPEEQYQLLKSGRMGSGDPFFFPSRDGWFKLDNVKGVETFYVIFSSQRMRNLEEAFRTEPATRRVFLVRQELKRLATRGIMGEPSTANPVAAPPSVSATFRGAGDLDYLSFARNIKDEDPCIEIIELRH